MKKSTSWDPLAYWYSGWVGKDGSKYHQKIAIPAVMKLLDLKKGEYVLDMGCGQGVLSSYIKKSGGKYVGVDVSEKLIKLAKRYHKEDGEFFLEDATRLFEKSKGSEIKESSFDAVIFLLSIQDMGDLEGAISSAACALKEKGRVVILMLHPCFRIPRQSGWGWDENRKLQFRRIDRYLTPLEVPLKKFPGKSRGVSKSFHRPLQDYVNTLGKNGFAINKILEIPTFEKSKPSTRPQKSKAQKMAEQEIPLFLGIKSKEM